MEEKRCLGCMRVKTASPVCEHCGYDEREQNASHQLPAGTILREQYLVGRVLGQGGFGITYLGWDLYLDIPVAIKEYFPSGAVMRETSVSLEVVSCGGDEGEAFAENRKRFLREAKTLARFSKVPEVVQVRNFFVDNNTAYIVMEYVEGITLKQYVRDRGGKLTPQETFAILSPIIQTLEKVHRAEVIHRDISPDNIMMLPGGGAKLLDFGAVRNVATAEVGKNLTQSTQSILKQGYAPIEQYQKKGNLGPWTDVYALCATMYYCLTGEVPPDAPERLLGYEDLEIRRKIPALTAEQEKALEHGMALRVEDRILSMEQLHGELLPAPKPEPPKPQPAPPVKPPEPLAEPPKPPVSAKKPTKKKMQPGRLSAYLVVAAILLISAALAVDWDMLHIGTRKGTCGSGVSWALNMGTGELTVSGDGTMQDYLWAEETESGEGLAPWYQYRDVIRAVTFDADVDNVGAYAFAGCTGLESLTLNSAVQEIGDGAFRGTALVEVELPETVRYVGDLVFNECAALESLTVHRDTVISYDTWRGPLVTDENGEIPSGFTLKGDQNTLAEDYANCFGYAFTALSTAEWDAQGSCGANLTWYLDFETGLLKIDGEGTMWDYNGLWQNEEQELGYLRNRQLAPWVEHADKIQRVSIGGGVTTIGENAFARCVYLTDVHFGGSLETICSYAFHSTDVDQIVMPDNITKIEPLAFAWCLDLEYVQLPGQLETLEGCTFDNCGNLKAIYIGADTILDDSEITPFGQLTSTGIPGDITIYSVPGSDAERFCEDYLFPEFAPGYWGMDIRAHGQCGDDVSWFLANDVLFLHGTGDTWLYRITDEDRESWALEYWPEEWLRYEDPEYYQYREEIRHIVVLPGVRSLNHNLFLDMPNLRSIDYGTAEEMHCTLQNTGIESISIPRTMKGVGEWSIAYNENLRVVKIEGGSEYVGMGLLEGCMNLEEVWFSGAEHIDDGEDLLNPNGEGNYSRKAVFSVKLGTDGCRYAQENGLEYQVRPE